jgi:pyruvate/oxaloacetate carboxyltransferase
MKPLHASVIVDANASHRLQQLVDEILESKRKQGYTEVVSTSYTVVGYQDARPTIYSALIIVKYNPETT